MSTTRGKMWMGTRGYEQWVPAPDARPDTSRIGNVEQDLYLNGGAGIRGTKEGHKEYPFTWTGKQSLDLQVIADLAAGNYDTGIGDDLIYFIDPSVAEQNVLSAMHAAPFKTAIDGMPMVTDGEGYPQYPTAVPTLANTNRYPVRSARYAINNASVGVKLYVPIPPGTTLWFGAHGQDNGAAVLLTPYKGLAATTTTIPDMLSVTTRTRFNASVASADGYTGVELALGRRAPGNAEVTSDFAGIMVQILPAGRPPLDGGFISGQGHSGCEFASLPTETPYLAGRMKTMTARLVETGAWR